MTFLISQRINCVTNDQMTKYKEKILLMTPSLSCQVKNGSLSKEILKENKTLTSLLALPEKSLFPVYKNG